MLRRDFLRSIAAALGISSVPMLASAKPLSKLEKAGRELGLENRSIEFINELDLPSLEEQRNARVAFHDGQRYHFFSAYECEQSAKRRGWKQFTCRALTEAERFEATPDLKKVPHFVESLYRGSDGLISVIYDYPGRKDFR